MSSARVAMLPFFVLLAGCAGHPGHAPHAIEPPASWDNGVSPISGAESDERWWVLLRDPVIDRLVGAAMEDSPTLAEALARLDQAKAALNAGRAGRLPRVDVSGAAAYGQQNLGTAGGANAVNTATASVSPGISWEIDLWGRVRRTVQAAESRLDARTADARGARLTIAAEIAAGVLRLRACNYSLGVSDRDIESRKQEIGLIRTQVRFGAVAPVELSAALSNLASAETERVARTEECAREINALVAQSGIDAAEIRRLLGDALVAREQADIRTGTNAELAAVIPAAPPMQPVLPATVLLAHPSVVAAEREAGARWSEIGVAKAERLPRIDLAALLTGQWLRAMGSSSSFTTWSIGPQAAGTVFDGGAGAAGVRSAQARYREAVAALDGELRNAVRSIEDGLAAQQSASDRVRFSRDNVAAARHALTATEVRWRAGAVSRFELEDARRQFARAQESAIGAARDDAAAWVELVRVSGNGFAISGDAAATATQP